MALKANEGFHAQIHWDRIQSCLRLGSSATSNSSIYRVNKSNQRNIFNISYRPYLWISFWAKNNKCKLAIWGQIFHILQWYSSEENSSSCTMYLIFSTSMRKQMRQRLSLISCLCCMHLNVDTMVASQVMSSRHGRSTMINLALYKQSMALSSAQYIAASRLQLYKSESAGAENSSITSNLSPIFFKW